MDRLRKAARAGLAMAAFGGAIGCGAAIPRDAVRSVVSLAELDDGDRGGELARSLSEESGVYRVAFDPRRAELTIVARPGLDAFGLVKQVEPKDASYQPVRGAGHGTYVAWETAPADADVKVIAVDGVDVPDLAPYLVHGKVTLVDFSARWCAPCRTLDAHVLRAIRGRNDVAYRKIEIGDWDSPVAQHYMKDVATLPFVIVFDKEGREIDRVIGVDEPMLDAAIARGASRD